MAETPLWFPAILFMFMALAICVILGTTEPRRQEITQSLTISHCPKCGIKVDESDYFCPACGQRLISTTKEEIELTLVSTEELEAKVTEFAHQGNVRRIVVMNDTGEYIMETTVTPKGIETNRFHTFTFLQYEPLHNYTLIVEGTLEKGTLEKVRKEESSRLENYAQRQLDITRHNKYDTVSRQHKYNCPECGKSLTVYSPDVAHDKLTLNEEEANHNASGTVTQTTNQCTNCFRWTTLYWYRGRGGEHFSYMPDEL